ncbi:hypothetical protein ACRQ5Q_43555 (plasmid) [Bradyrhizobium sp. PMVTL-01]|uniref:hypothetical protein n=1 Tax=Bradyrhizobium sp. PMVTL-01 TaxID=3434999 RepID=UPI003F726161
MKVSGPEKSTKELMSILPGKIQDRPFQMRASEEFLKAIDAWRRKQADQPSRAEAIRRLVQIGLESKAKDRRP